MLQYTFAQNISSYDLDLTIIALNQYSPEFKDKIEQTGAKVEIFAGDKLLHGRRLRSIYQYLRMNQFDLIHTHLQYGNIIGTSLGWLTGTPVVSTLHSIKMREKKYSGKLERFLLKNVSRRVIAVGGAVANAHQSWVGEAKLMTIPNAVSEAPEIVEQERLAIRTEMMGDPSLRLLICVGRFHVPKGYPDLIEAFEQIHQSCPDTRLVIVGAGDLFEEIEQLIIIRGLSDVIKLTGLRYDVPRLLAASDLYVNSSWWEGLPVTILEAMSAKLPVVATDAGDTSNVVLEDTGIVVPTRSPDKIAKSVIELLAQPEHMQELGINGYQQVQAKYTASVWVERLINLYEEVISEV